MPFNDVKNKFPVRFNLTDGGLVTPNTLNALSHFSYVIFAMVMDSVFMPSNDRGYGIVGASDVTLGSRTNKYTDFQVTVQLNGNNLIVTINKGVSPFSLARLGTFTSGIYANLPRYSVLSANIVKTVENVTSTTYYVYITPPSEISFNDGNEFSTNKPLFPAQYLPASATHSSIVSGLEITGKEIRIEPTPPAGSNYLLLAQIKISGNKVTVIDKREFLVPKIPYYSVDGYSVFKSDLEIPERDNPFIPIHRAIDNVIRYAWALPYLSPSSLFRKGIEKVNVSKNRSLIEFLRPQRENDTTVSLILSVSGKWEEHIINVGGLAYRHNVNTNEWVSSILNKLDVPTEDSSTTYFYKKDGKLYCKLPQGHFASNNFRLLDGSQPPIESYIILGLVLMYNPSKDIFIPAWAFLPRRSGGGVNYHNNVFAIYPPGANSEYLSGMCDGNFAHYNNIFYPLFGLPVNSISDYVVQKSIDSSAGCTIFLNRDKFKPGSGESYGSGLYNSIYYLAFNNTKVFGVGPSGMSEGSDRLSALLVAIVGIQLTSSGATITGIYKTKDGNIEFSGSGIEDQRTFGILFAQDIRIEPKYNQNEYVSFDLSSANPLQNIAKLTDYSLRDYIDDLNQSIVFPDGYSGFPTQPPYGKKIPALYNDEIYGETLPEEFLRKYLAKYLSRSATLTVILKRKSDDPHYVEPSEFRDKMVLLGHYLREYIKPTSGPIIIDIIAEPIRRKVGETYVYTTEGAVRFNSNTYLNIEFGPLPDHRQIILRFGVGLFFDNTVSDAVLTFKFYKDSSQSSASHNPSVIISNLLVTYNGSNDDKIKLQFMGCKSITGSNDTLENPISITLVNSYIQSPVKVSLYGNDIIVRNVNENPYQSLTYGGAFEIAASNKVRITDCSFRYLWVRLYRNGSNYNAVENTVYIDRTVVGGNLDILADIQKPWKEIKLVDFRKEDTSPNTRVQIKNFEILNIDRSSIRNGILYIYARENDGHNRNTFVYIANSHIELSLSLDSKIREVHMCRIDNSYFKHYGNEGRVSYVSDYSTVLFENIRYLFISNSQFYFRFNKSADVYAALIRYGLRDTQPHYIAISSSSFYIDLEKSPNTNDDKNFYLITQESGIYRHMVSSSRLEFNKTNYKTQIFEYSVDDNEGYIMCVGCFLKARKIVHEQEDNIFWSFSNLNNLTGSNVKINKLSNVIIKD